MSKLDEVARVRAVILDACKECRRRGIDIIPGVFGSKDGPNACALGAVRRTDVSANWDVQPTEYAAARLGISRAQAWSIANGFDGVDEGDDWLTGMPTDPHFYRLGIELADTLFRAQKGTGR